MSASTDVSYRDLGKAIKWSCNARKINISADDLNMICGLIGVYIVIAKIPDALKYMIYASLEIVNKTKEKEGGYLIQRYILQSFRFCLLALITDYAEQFRQFSYDSVSANTLRENHYKENLEFVELTLRNLNSVL